MPKLNGLAKSLFLVATLVGAAFAQQTVVSKHCDLAVFGVKDADSFLTFDRELHDAFSKDDVGRVALLVKYPLRVNDGRGSYFIESAAALQGRFDAVFSGAVRNAVIKSAPDTIACNYAGIRYGRGEVWVNLDGDRYKIEAVNVAIRLTVKEPQRGDVRFACAAKRHRAIIDIGIDGAPRYRAWDEPHSLTQNPDTEITHGTETIEGTGPTCAHRVWRFEHAKTHVVVEELGCEDNQLPTGATGRLASSDGDQAEWCF